MDRERIFEINVRTESLHLRGRDEVAELIGLLGQSLVDASSVDGKPKGYDWNIRWDHDPVKMECRHREEEISPKLKVLRGRTE